ncbi:hypothetical protein EDD17DRAFT_1889545 [Pisolithus thermaeus]|nr:hypothetical protein EV401DRAFT_2087719 [Pisolithus croceorrhizus]KAI6149116.1 hypothetical protein EDD17DRAFT_1889545 [Pisolithus thermaeus]
MKAKLHQFWRDYEYLIIDKMSMIGKMFLAKLSPNSSTGKIMEGTAVSPRSFDGAPYVPGRPQRRVIYEEFPTIVILRKQMQVMDNIWLGFLDHLQMGCVREERIATFRQLISWSDVCLVTPRHAVRQHWNEAVLCNVVLLCNVHGTINGAPLSIEERYAFALRTGGGELQKPPLQGDLPNTVELSEPPPPPTHDIVRLKFMPAYILVELCRTRTSQLPTSLP